MAATVPLITLALQPMAAATIRSRCRPAFRWLYMFISVLTQPRSADRGSFARALFPADAALQHLLFQLFLFRSRLPAAMVRPLPTGGYGDFGLRRDCG